MMKGREPQMNRLLVEIEKFKKWSELTFPCRIAGDIGGEWETGYNGWDAIYAAFEEALNRLRPEDFTADELAPLLYIIARDNECEILAQTLSEHDVWFVKVCHLALQSSDPEARWQLASRLHGMKDHDQAKRFLEAFVRDEDEYVSRRALLEMPALQPDRVEDYAAWFWDRDCHAEMQEYQRMAALTVLEDVHSPLLEEYLERARSDGRPYLLSCADRILSRRKRPGA